MRIAVDAMGGDFGPAVTLPACLSFLSHHADASVVIVGLGAELAKHKSHAALASHSRCSRISPWYQTTVPHVTTSPSCFGPMRRWPCVLTVVELARRKIPVALIVTMKKWQVGCHGRSTSRKQTP